MSYILEALKMSEQARREGAPATPHSLLAPARAEEKEPERAWLRYLLVGALVLINVAAIVLWQRPANPDAATSAPVPPAAAEAAPASSAPSAMLQASPPSVSRAEPPPAAAKPVAAPAAAPAAQAASEGRVEPPAAAPAPNVAMAAPPPALPAPPAKAATVEPARSDGMPADVAKQMPPLAVSGFIQDDAGDNDIVIVNDKLVREGDEAAPGVKLEKILPDGVVFNYKGYRFKR
jgi:general secretion pathway protein B